MVKNDFTKGSITKYFMYLTIPLIIGNILQQLYNTIDALIVGKFVGVSQFAAVGVASSVMNLFLFAVVGACIGISVLFAQFYGAKDFNTFRREHFTALVTGLLFSAAAAAAGCIGIKHLLSILQTPLEIMGYSEVYLKVVLSALPFSFIYNFYSALLRAVGKVRIPIFILAAAVLINISLDLFFVVYCKAGIDGVAWATWIAQTSSAIISIGYVFIFLPELRFRRKDCGINGKLLKITIHYSCITGLQQAGLYLGKLLVQGAVNTMGTSVISAYTATTRIEGFANSFGDSGCSATSVITAQNHGAQNNERVLKTLRTSFVFLGILGIISSVILFFAAEPLIKLLMDNAAPQAYESAEEYLQFIALFYILCFTGSTFAGYFDGCGKVTVTFIGTVTQIFIRVVLSWILIYRFELNAVAAATVMGWLFVNIFWLVQYRKSKK